jgi:hypothetical protein
MKTFVCSVVAACTLLFTFDPTVNAQDKGSKKDPVNVMVTQFMKQLEKAELKEDEANKIKEMFAKVAKEVSKTRSESGITTEILKKRAEAAKAAKQDGKKGKEAQAAIEESMGLTEEQSKVYQETEAVLGKVRVEIGKLMTAEQLAKLPENAQNAFKQKAGKGKKNKNS